MAVCAFLCDDEWVDSINEVDDHRVGSGKQ